MANGVCTLRISDLDAAHVSGIHPGIGKSEDRIVKVDETSRLFSNDSTLSPIGSSVNATAGSETREGESIITEEDLKLRRVSGKIPWTAYSIAFVELCERFSYYGTTVVFVNFIQQPLPPGSTTGAGFKGQSGALGMGQQTSTALTTFNAFWAYIMPLVGAYVADEWLGRFKTIGYSIAIAMIGHIVLIVSALPQVIPHESAAVAVFTVGLIVLGLGTGGFKSNISPLIAEQLTHTHMTAATTKKGERVLVDPAVTISRVYLYFYLMINIGSLLGQVSMIYAEKYVGFWLAFLLPTLMFCLSPMVMFACRKRYQCTPPTGSVTAKAFKIWRLAMRPCWSWNLVRMFKNAHADGFWERAKPSNIPQKPHWMTFDDAWVDEVRRGLKACVVFLWLPLYWLCYSQMGNNLVSQASTMTLHGAPNEITNNLNPFSLIIFIPIMDLVIYPAFRKYNIRFTPLKRICSGFFFASAAMVASTILQVYIYRLSPCGTHANKCGSKRPTNISVWWQAIPYVLTAFSEIMTACTSLEYAFTKAPKNMRSLVVGISIFMMAFAAAIRQALVPLSKDPFLVWNYGVVAVLAFVAGCLFWVANRKLDKEEDKLNMLQESEYVGKGKTNEETVLKEVVEKGKM